MFSLFCLNRLGDTCYALLDDGIANVLALETLRHGTNPINYLGIRILGGDPQKGGAESGATPGNSKDDPSGHFYTIKDSDYDEVLYESGLWKSSLAIAFSKRIAPRAFASMSCLNLGKMISSNKIIQTIMILSGSLITPTVRFRFDQIDLQRFKEDNAYQDLQYARPTAYKTDQKIEAWRIGLMGSLLTGFNTQWLSRAKQHPSKVLTGVIQLASCTALTAIFGFLY